VTTNSFQGTIQTALDQANPNQLADLLHLVRLGKMTANIKAVVTSLSAAASFDITSAAVFAAAVVTGLNSEGGDLAALPAIRALRSLRVTASGTTNAVGTYVLTDSSGTGVDPGNNANVGICKISDDGKTLTFGHTITGFTIEYLGAAQTDPTTSYPATS
jgi:hypothetical protein